MGVSVWDYVQESADASGRLEGKGLRCYELELQAIVRIFGMGGKIELRSSPRTVSTANHWAIHSYSWSLFLDLTTLDSGLEVMYITQRSVAMKPPEYTKVLSL